MARWTPADDALLRRQIAINTPEAIAALMGRSVADVRSRIAGGDGIRESGGNTRSKSGRRADLGNVYFRSRWEANYARYLNVLERQGAIYEWLYEPCTFWFDDIKRGTRSYTPDFELIYPDGTRVFHEIKGWMDPKSKTRISRMQRYWPEFVVEVIDETWFKGAIRSGLASSIRGWEFG